MSKVYFFPVDSYKKTKIISEGARILLEKLVSDEKIMFEKKVPLKVHFGEKGNQTFISAMNYQGILDHLDGKGFYIETNVLYHGSRTRRKSHIKLAKQHGFTNAPIVIADGDHGDEFTNIVINKKHFSKCMVGKEFSKYDTMIILSHFKGHTLAGFGGAIKQLGMGCASRGGKLAMHSNLKPFIIPFKCKKCGICRDQCPEDAIHIGRWSRIDKKKCVGCAACTAVCPNRAIKLNFLSPNLSKGFYERLAEYAYAAQKGKQNIYISFAFNITRGCDCEGHKMKPFLPDLGIFASTDPVAIDTAVLDMLDKRKGKKTLGGRHTLVYAEKIGLGSRKYKLVK